MNEANQANQSHTPEPWYARLARTILANPQNLTNLLPAVSFTLMALLIWYGISVLVPEIQNSFHRELQLEREIFRQELRLIRAEVERQREVDERRTERFLKAIDANQKAIEKHLSIDEPTLLRIIQDALRKMKWQDLQSREPRSEPSPCVPFSRWSWPSFLRWVSARLQPDRPLPHPDPVGSRFLPEPRTPPSGSRTFRS